MSFFKDLFSADNIIDNICAGISILLIINGIVYIMFFVHVKYKIIIIVIYAVAIHYLFRALYKLIIKIFKIKQI